MTTPSSTINQRRLALQSRLGTQQPLESQGDTVVQALRELLGPQPYRRTPRYRRWLLLVAVLIAVQLLFVLALRGLL